jgi:serine/threonine protein kinase
MTQTTHQNALPLGSMLMEYRLVSVLGAGGFGITYLARDVNLEKDVAIKEYLPSAFATRTGTTVVPTSASAEHDYKWGLDRFIQEARTLAKFSHPHIVRVNRFFESNGTGYMVMDYEAGVPLKAWLHKHAPVSEALLKALMMPLLDGLEKVHAAGFLHRDVKPDNIFVREDGGPVLIDFGAARQAMSGPSQTLTTIVSPGYAPFEQYTTTSEQGPWSDIYALCGVLYFAVTGQNPPDAITRMKADTVAQGLTAARGRYSAPFLRAIEWGLALEDAKRPRTVGELHEALFGRAAAPASGATSIKTAQLLRQIATAPAVPATPHVRTERVEPLTPAVTIIASPQRKERGRNIWRSAVPALVAVAVMGFGFRSMSRTPSPVNAAANPPAVATQPAAPAHSEPASAGAALGSTSHPAATGTEQPVATSAAEAPAPAAPFAAAEPQARATPPSPAPQSLAEAGTHTPPTLAPAQGAVTATPMPPTPIGSPPHTAGLESALRGGDTSGSTPLGMTREELAKSYPEMTARFEHLDDDHDGRISPQELVDALQALQGERARTLE